MKSIHTYSCIGLNDTLIILSDSPIFFNNEICLISDKMELAYRFEDSNENCEETEMGDLYCTAIYTQEGDTLTYFLTVQITMCIN